MLPESASAGTRCLLSQRVMVGVLGSEVVCTAHPARQGLLTGAVRGTQAAQVRWTLAHLEVRAFVDFWPVHLACSWPQELGWDNSRPLGKGLCWASSFPSPHFEGG